VGLTNDLSQVLGAIDVLPDRMAEHTRLDLALGTGTDTALDPARHKPENDPVVILLTDGLPNQVPYDEDGTVETTVLRQATRAKEAGVVIYTIGVGVPDSPDINERINPVLLRAIASNEDYYFQTPDAEDVGAIYAGLKLVKKCERLRGWEVGFR
jgi:Mg-chelatase subunit ChlD